MAKHDLDTLIAFIGSLPDEDPLEGGGLESVDKPFGSYEGTPAQVEFNDNDGRSGRLLRAMVYHRQDGVDWAVPLGAWLDGASIPQPLWSIVGGPYEGKYRTASIIHDHFCITKSRSWRDTHRMFHDAMRCSGVGSIKAAVMFYAVFRCGPRWPNPSLEMIGDTNAPTPLINANAEELWRDCEAIAEHGLNIAEIESLADAREHQVGARPSALEWLGATAGLSAAELLVIAGGSATAEDVSAVVETASGLPEFVAQRFFDKKIRIVACRGSVTDFESDLRNVIPRGWESLGRTWDSVPGAYFSDRRRVVVSTTDAGERRVVPDKSVGSHGSENLVIHESLHGFDYSGNHAILAEPSFVAARNADNAGLTDYQKQDGRAGLEETFAETGAQFCSAPALLAESCPNLTQFWASMPIETEVLASAFEAIGTGAVADDPLGTVARRADGSLRFDLRATGPGGAIGEAIIDFDATDPRYKALNDRLFPDDGLESVGPKITLFYG